MLFHYNHCCLKYLQQQTWQRYIIFLRVFYFDFYLNELQIQVYNRLFWTINKQRRLNKNYKPWNCSDEMFSNKNNSKYMNIHGMLLSREFKMTFVWV